MRRNICLVTGGAGFIGSHIVDALLVRGDKVVVIDDCSTGNHDNLKNKDCLFYKNKIRDIRNLDRIVSEVDYVFHQAALPSVPRSIESPLESHENCCTETVRLLKACSNSRVKRIVYAASSSAYGNLPCDSKRESDATSPLSPYAAAKLAGELYCHAFGHSYGIETVCLRYFNVFGPRQNSDGGYAAVIPRFIKLMLAGEPLTVYGDGKQTRDFTYVENVVHANLLAADAPNVSGQTFNIAGGESTSINSLISMLEDRIGLGARVNYEPPRQGDVLHSLADLTRAKAFLRYVPKVSVGDGLSKTLDSFTVHRQFAQVARAIL